MTDRHDPFAVRRADHPTVEFSSHARPRPRHPLRCPITAGGHDNRLITFGDERERVGAIPQCGDQIAGCDLRVVLQPDCDHASADIVRTV